MSQTFPLRFNGLQMFTAIPCDMDATKTDVLKSEHEMQNGLGVSANRGLHEMRLSCPGLSAETRAMQPEN
jgi:hypothetical protein